MNATRKETTTDDSLVLYAELSPAQIRTVHPRLRGGELRRIAPGVVTNLPEEAWPTLIARERVRVSKTAARF